MIHFFDKNQLVLALRDESLLDLTHNSGYMPQTNTHYVWGGFGGSKVLSKGISVMVFQGLVFGITDISSYVSDHCRVCCSSFREAACVTSRPNKSPQILFMCLFSSSISIFRLLYILPSPSLLSLFICPLPLIMSGLGLLSAAHNALALLPLVTASQKGDKSEFAETPSFCGDKVASLEALESGFHGRHVELMSCVLQLNQNPSLFTRQGFLQKKKKCCTNGL